MILIDALSNYMWVAQRMVKFLFRRSARISHGNLHLWEKNATHYWVEYTTQIEHRTGPCQICLDTSSWANFLCKFQNSQFISQANHARRNNTVAQTGSSLCSERTTEMLWRKNYKESLLLRMRGCRKKILTEKVTTSGVNGIIVHPVQKFHPPAGNVFRNTATNELTRRTTPTSNLASCRGSEKKVSPAAHLHLFLLLSSNKCHHTQADKGRKSLSACREKSRDRTESGVRPPPPPSSSGASSLCSRPGDSLRESTNCLSPSRVLREWVCGLLTTGAVFD